MADAADAIEALNHLVDLNTERCEALREQLRKAHENYEKHLNELEAQLTAATASPWRSMEDNGPPEENGPYFVYAPSYRGGSSSGKESARGVMISKWSGKHWSIEVGYYKRPGCVTHWMPIEPPKEDA
jgi:hypothetical protein